MTPAELLSDLRSAGAVVHYDGIKLRIDAAPGLLTFAQVGRIKQMRNDLIDLLDWKPDVAAELRKQCVERIGNASPDDFAFRDDPSAWRAKEDAVDAAIAEQNLPAVRTALAAYEEFARDEFGRWRDERAVIDLDVFDFESLPIWRY